MSATDRGHIEELLYDNCGEQIEVIKYVRARQLHPTERKRMVEMLEALRAEEKNLERQWDLVVFGEEIGIG